MKKIITTLILFFLLGKSSFSQQIVGNVTGWVTDTKKSTLSSITVSLKKALDSTLIKISVSDKNGKFIFSELPFEKYFITVSAINIDSTNSVIFELGKLNSNYFLDTLIAEEHAYNLSSVTVTSKKYFIEQKLGEMVLNVEASITNIGSTALEVLEKLPGITIDKDGNISLKGKPNVMVMIDGKPSYLNGGDLANLLSNMNSNQLSQIEIMTNPGAKYDASGNAGLINIKTKKNLTNGFNGNINLSYGQGVYPKTNNSLMLNYRKGKINTFLNYGYILNKNYIEVSVVRNFLDNAGIKISELDQETRLINQSQNNNLKIGVDYYLNEQTTIGFVATGFIAPQNQRAETNSLIKDAMGNVTLVEKTSKTANNNWNNKTLNFYFHNKKGGDESNANLDYLRYNFSGNQNVNGSTYNTSNQLLFISNLKNILPLNLDVYSGRYDFSHSITDKTKIELGLKSSFVKTNNTTLFYTFLNSQEVLNDTLSNKFEYSENINAAYFNFNKKINKWNIQAGLRVENTNYKGQQISYSNKKDSTFNRSYLSVFPTLFISHQLNDNHQVSISIGRRIDRPAYQQLNPFVSIIDKYMRMAGNPYLQPQISKNIELSYTYKNKFTTTVNYGIITNMINETMMHEDSFIVRSMGNIGIRYNYGVSQTAVLPFTKWYTGIFFINLFNNKYDGMINGYKLNASQLTMSLNVNNQFIFNNGWSAEVSVSYTTKSREEGQAISLPFGFLSAGLSKSLMQNKASLKISIRDIFNSQTPKEIQNFQDVTSMLERVRDTRVINIAFVYRFGSQQKTKTTQQTEEQKRIQLN